MKRPARSAHLAALAALLFPAAAPAGPGDVPSPRAVVSARGSDTIGAALGPALARAFEAASPGTSVRWEGLGSATAFPGLLDGSADLGASSRSVNAEELARAKDLGVELKEYVLGYDGIAVIVHPSNPVTRLAVEQVSRLFRGEVRSWAELGGAEVAPAIYGRPPYSGTHAFFEEKVVKQGDRRSPARFAPGVVHIEHSEALVAAVARDPRAVGYVGMGHVGPDVAVVAVAATAGKPFVLPAAESVRTGAYPVYRPLLLYTRGEPRGELRRFLQFVLAGEGRRIVAAHDFTPPDVPATVLRTAEPAQAAAPPPRLHVWRVRFGVRSAELGPEAQVVLRRAAAAAKRPGARVRVVGHADSHGAAQDNTRLARERAASVAAALERLGLPRDVLRIEVAGEGAPLATNDTPAGRRENRRVDVEVVAPPAGGAAAARPRSAAR